MTSRVSDGLVLAYSPAPSAQAPLMKLPNTLGLSIWLLLTARHVNVNGKALPGGSRHAFSPHSSLLRAARAPAGNGRRVLSGAGDHAARRLSARRRHRPHRPGA